MVTEITDFFMAPLLRVDIRQLVGETIEEHTPEILDLNREQLAQGKTAEGDDIKPFYKSITVKIKKAKGQPTDRVTLRDEGSFYGGFYGKRVAGGTEIGSTDGKTGELVEKYTLDIFGLSVPSREQLSDRLRPTLQDKFKQSIV